MRISRTRADLSTSLGGLSKTPGKYGIANPVFAAPLAFY